MSKAEMQLAIIKKKKCDAKALTIVEQLLESKIDSQWLLSNLKYINKNHMEDVIEERAIIKLCGYVLCNNALKTITDQRYHISTKKNKVYDITRRKNFCSSHCYGASNYLLEQMLTSPLWLRDKEEIPEFQILLTKDKFIKNVVGDEIYVKDKMIMNPENTDKYIKNNKNCRKNMLPNKCSELNACNEYIKESSQINENIQTINIIKNSNVFKEFSKNLDETSEDIKNVSINSKDNSIKNFINDDTVKEIYNSKDNKINTIIQDTENINNDVIFSNENKDYNIKSEEKNEVFETSTTEYNINIITQDSINSNNDKDLMYVCKQKIKQKKFKQNSVKEEQSDKFYNLTIHIEHNVKEWITKDTIALLTGIEDIKNQLLENIIQHDRYLHLCKKLNKLQMEDEKDDCIDLTANILKPLPHLSILQEEGKRMELKVRAFYKGSMIIENHKNSTEVIEQDDFIPVLPLTDAHTPKKLRRRIFLDKLNKILPDLFNALTKNKLSQYVYNSEKSTLIKVLINTFSLSASNVIFKTAEWTLVGLIIIKMLSMIDPELKCLLSTKQALMYISMILMSYKLDSNYLERLIMELINN